MTYTHFHKIEDDSHLAGFFNHIMGNFVGMRTLCAPSSFHRVEEIADFQDVQFCNFCRMEVWMHALVERLNDWVDIIDEYFTQFEGSWEYYANSKRLEYIRECETDGEEVDEDTDLLGFTVLSDLMYEGLNDIVQDTVPDDLGDICANIIANSHTDILDGLAKHFGAEKVEIGRVGEDGEFVPMSKEDYDLEKISFQVSAEDDVKLIKAISASVCAIVTMIKVCKPKEDNKELLQMVYDAVHLLLRMELDPLSITIKKFGQKYADDIHDGEDTN